MMSDEILLFGAPRSLSDWVKEANDAEKDVKGTGTKHELLVSDIVRASERKRIDLSMNLSPYNGDEGWAEVCKWLGPCSCIEKFIDTYFDTSDFKLMKQGVWLRKRHGKHSIIHAWRVFDFLFTSSPHKDKVPGSRLNDTVDDDDDDEGEDRTQNEIRKLVGDEPLVCFARLGTTRLHFQPNTMIDITKMGKDGVYTLLRIKTEAPVAPSHLSPAPLRLQICNSKVIEYLLRNDVKIPINRDDLRHVTKPMIELPVCLQNILNEENARLQNLVARAKSSTEAKSTATMTADDEKRAALKKAFETALPKLTKENAGKWVCFFSESDHPVFSSEKEAFACGKSRHPQLYFVNHLVNDGAILQVQCRTVQERLLCKLVVTADDRGNPHSQDFIVDTGCTFELLLSKKTAKDFGLRETSKTKNARDASDNTIVLYGLELCSVMVGDEREIAFKYPGEARANLLRPFVHPNRDLIGLPFINRLNLEMNEGKGGFSLPEELR